MTLRTRTIALGAIIILAFGIRVWRVAEIPPSLSWDEVSIGYNAYSLLKTGRDEHGKFIPVDFFAAYGDYKPPLAIYLTVPSVMFFGLNEFAVRLPSVIAGALTVFLTYLLILELFGSSKVGQTVALLAGFILSVSPWHVQLSRAGFEANIALLLVMWGTWMILRARSVQRLLLYCWIPFVLSVYTFNSSRYFVPLFAIVLFLYCRTSFRKNTRLLVFGIVVAFLLILPITAHLLSKEARLRFTEVNIFSDAGIVQTANARIQRDGSSLLARFVHNRRVGYARSYLIHFLDHFQPWFLAIRGDGNPKFSIQDVGQMYITELPFFVLGIFWLARDNPKVFWFLVSWIVIALLPASVARETPHALRIENTLPVWQLFVAYGIYLVLQKLPKTVVRYGVLVLFVVYGLNIGYFNHNYFNHYAKEYSGEWQFGYREAIAYARSVKHRYESVVIDDLIGRPYMYALFYDRYDPKKFQDNPDRSIDAAGFYHVKGFDQYRFVDRGPAQFQKSTLYMLRPRLVPEHANIQETIRLLNGDPVLVIFDIVSDPLSQQSL